jgi:hypothetical protein
MDYLMLTDALPGESQDGDNFWWASPEDCIDWGWVVFCHPSF